MIEASAGIRAYYFGPIDAKRFKFSFKLPPKAFQKSKFPWE